MFLWHVISFEEPNPTGSRPSDFGGEVMMMMMHPATLGLPRRPVFLPSNSPPETNRAALVAGSVKRGAGVRLPGFPVFVRQVTHHLPEGTALHRLHPPPLARIDENPPLDPGSD